MPQLDNTVFLQVIIPVVALFVLIGIRFYDILAYGLLYLSVLYYLVGFQRLFIRSLHTSIKGIIEFVGQWIFVLFLAIQNIFNLVKSNTMLLIHALLSYFRPFFLLYFGQIFCETKYSWEVK